MLAVSEWFHTFDNVKTLGSALVDAGLSAGRLQSYYEKPWAWTREWEALQTSQDMLERVLDNDTWVCRECESDVQPDVPVCPHCGQEGSAACS
jgi:hypothetical protein